MLIPHVKSTIGMKAFKIVSSVFKAKSEAHLETDLNAKELIEVK